MKKYFHKRNKLVVPLVLILLGVVGEKKNFHLNFIYSLKARNFKSKKKYQTNCVFFFHFLWWEKEKSFAVNCVLFKKKTTVLLLLLFFVVVECCSFLLRVAAVECILFLLSDQYAGNVLACDAKGRGNRIGFDLNI